MGIKYLNIETYKGLVEKELVDLGDVNILVGDNNTCKTTFLEAVSLVSGKTSENDIYEIVRNRLINNKSESYFQSFVDLFKSNVDMSININSDINNFSIEGEIFEKTDFVPVYEFDDIIGDNNIIDRHSVYFFRFKGEIRNFNGIERDIEPITVDSNSFPMIFFFDNVGGGDYCKLIFSDSHLKSININKLISNNILDDDAFELKKLLKCFDENIEDILFIPSQYSNEAILMIKHTTKGYISLANYGDGIKKVILFATSIMSIKKGGILLIDEIETSLHVSALENVFSWLVKVCKERNIQLFATTHSREALETLTKQAGEVDVDLVVYRLENFRDDIYINRLPYKNASSILEEGGDLR